MSTMIFWLLLPLVIALGVIGWATESRHTRIRRWRDQGQTWRVIAERLGVSVSTARRWAVG